MNGEWTRSLGWEEQEFKDRSFLSFVHPDDLEDTLAAIAKHREVPDSNLHVENRIEHKDGSYRWLSWHALSQAEGGRFYAVALDVTEARALRAHQARLAFAVARTDNSVVVTDRQGRIEWVNEGFTRLTGFEPGEVIGELPFRLFQGPRSDPAADERMRIGMEKGLPFSEELLNYRKDGCEFWVQLDCQPMLGPEGQAQGFMTIGRDITERHQHNAELLQAKERADSAAQASAQANQAKSVFLASMSHEIRTPLNGVLGMAQLLLDTELDEEQGSYAERILGSGRTLLSLLDDLLDFSKVEAGEFGLSPEPFKLRRIISEVVELFEGNAQAKGLELLAEVDPRLPERVLGDGPRLRQVLSNLVGNGIKFTAQGSVRLYVA